MVAQGWGRGQGSATVLDSEKAQDWATAPGLVLGQGWAKVPGSGRARDWALVPVPDLAQVQGWEPARGSVTEQESEREPVKGSGSATESVRVWAQD